MQVDVAMAPLRRCGLRQTWQITPVSARWHTGISPSFSSGGRTAINTQLIWQILYNNDVDVILNGHDHIYERFAPQSPDGTLDTERGIREFVVGTGGSNLTEIETFAANSEVRNNDTYGMLKLTLHPAGYDWQFVPETGKTFTDSGTGKCHGEVADWHVVICVNTDGNTFPYANSSLYASNHHIYLCSCRGCLY